MRTTTAFCIALMSLLLAFSTGASAAWVTYTSDGAHYRVSFPTQPAVHVGGHDVNASFDGAGFEVTYSDLRAGQAYSLDQARDAMVKQLHATLVREAATRTGGVPGRQLLLSATSPNGLVWREDARIFIAGSRVYEALCLYPKSDASAIASSAAKFLDSLRVGDVR
jgi:hypothetical protein